MTYLRVQVRGTLPDGEVWSCTTSYFSTALPGTPLAQSAMNECALTIANVAPGATMRNYMSTAAALTGARIEQRATNDDLLAVGEAVRTTPLVGATPATKPFQTAVVLSLRTAVPGRSGRGRIYWPALGAGISTTSLRITTEVMETLLSEFDVYFTAFQGAINAMLGTGTAQLAVRSGLLRTENRVNTLEMGDVLDVQRRRRDKAIETRVSLGR